jgi:hypothetical protein
VAMITLGGAIKNAIDKAANCVTNASAGTC